jgi:hypothetical protein
VKPPNNNNNNNNFIGFSHTNSDNCFYNSEPPNNSKLHDITRGFPTFHHSIPAAFGYGPIQPEPKKSGPTSGYPSSLDLTSCLPKGATPRLQPSHFASPIYHSSVESHVPENNKSSGIFGSHGNNNNNNNNNSSGNSIHSAQRSQSHSPLHTQLLTGCGMEPYQAHNLKFRSNILPPKAADFSDLLQATSTPWLIKSNHMQKSNERLVEPVVSSNLVTATANLAGLNNGPDKSKQSFEESSAVSNPFSPVVSSSFQSARDVSICI